MNTVKVLHDVGFQTGLAGKGVIYACQEVETGVYFFGQKQKNNGENIEHWHYMIKSYIERELGYADSGMIIYPEYLSYIASFSDKPDADVLFLKQVPAVAATSTAAAQTVLGFTPINEPTTALPRLFDPGTPKFSLKGVGVSILLHTSLAAAASSRIGIDTPTGSTTTGTSTTTTVTSTATSTKKPYYQIARKDLFGNDIEPIKAFMTEDGKLPETKGFKGFVNEWATYAKEYWVQILLAILLVLVTTNWGRAVLYEYVGIEIGDVQDYIEERDYQEKMAAKRRR